MQRYGAFAAWFLCVAVVYWWSGSLTMAGASGIVAGVVAWVGLGFLLDDGLRVRWAVAFWALAADEENERVANSYRMLGNLISPWLPDGSDNDVVVRDFLADAEMRQLLFDAMMDDIADSEPEWGDGTYV